MNTNGIEAMTLPALTMALDAAVMRQQVIAANIANSHSEGYRPLRASFSAVMAQQSARAGQEGSTLRPALQMHVAPEQGPSIDGAVRLDHEVALMAQNGAHYQTLLKAVNRHLAIMSAAVSDGKR